MKIRTLSKLINQGEELGKYCLGHFDKKVYHISNDTGVVWTCGKVTVTVYNNGHKLWELGDKLIRVHKDNRKRK